MKKLFFLLPVIVVCFFVMTGQKADDPQKWSQPFSTGIYDPSVTTAGPLPQVFDYYNPNAVTRVVQTPFETLVLPPSMRPLPRTNSYQSEVIIVRHPTNPLIMLGSSNAFNNTGSLFISEGVYVTTNGGTNWYGSDTVLSAPGVPVPNHGGDPGPAIDKDGNFIMTHLGFQTSGMFGNYSTNNGLTWSSNYTIQSGSVDKNLAGTDDSPTSPYYGRSYCTYVAFTSPYPATISYTSNGGVSWSAPSTILTPNSGYIVRGTDIRTGRNGEVYVCWANGSTGNGIEDFASFAKSTNGGVTFTGINNAFDMNGLLVFGTGFAPYGIRMNSFPRIDVDRSGGPRDGWIYILVSQKNLAPAGSDPDIVLHRSTDGGTTWSGGIRVNQDPLNNGKYQFYNAIRVDENGGVNCVYYDNRNTSADSAEVMLSRSLDGGDTWTDVVVSDHRFKPKSIGTPGIAAGYAGDYIGVTSGNNKLWPIWMDDVSGIFQAWVSEVQLANYPLNSFNLQTPAAGARYESLPNSTAPSLNSTWDTSASTASYKWVFGNPTPTPRKITQSTINNSLSLNQGQLDAILAGIGLNQGDSLVGQWDVWAYRNNAPSNDSMKATNGPRAITLKRGIPALTAFNLSSPPSGTTIQTTPTDMSLAKPNWTKSGQGTKFKWKYAVPNFSNPANVKAVYQSDNNGFDTLVSIRISALDSLAASLGLGNNDSVSGQWRVYAYAGADSIASTQTFDLKLRRLPIATVTIGTGTTGESYPLNRFYNYFRWQGIYLGSEINLTGQIRKLRFYQNNSVAGITNENLRIFMKTTTDALLPTGNWDSTGMTMVYSGITTSLASPGWQEITLTTPITVNPALNVMIGIGRDFQQYVNTYPTYAYTSSSPNYRSRRGQSDTQYPVSLTQSFNRANIQFEISLMTGISNNNITSIPDVYALSQNYPNPFNPTTVINFSIPKQGMVTMKVYDVLGKEVMTLVNEQKAAGSYNVDFNGVNLSSGVYFYRMESAEFVDIKRMILIK